MKLFLATGFEFGYAVTALYFRNESISKVSFPQINPRLNGQAINLDYFLSNNTTSEADF